MREGLVAYFVASVSGAVDQGDVPEAHKPGRLGGECQEEREEAELLGQVPSTKETLVMSRGGERGANAGALAGILF